MPERPAPDPFSLATGHLEAATDELERQAAQAHGLQWAQARVIVLLVRWLMASR
jgi:hypothetical protein